MVNYMVVNCSLGVVNCMMVNCRGGAWDVAGGMGVGPLMLDTEV